MKTLTKTLLIIAMTVTGLSLAASTSEAGWNSGRRSKIAKWVRLMKRIKDSRRHDGHHGCRPRPGCGHHPPGCGHNPPGGDYNPPGGKRPPRPVYRYRLDREYKPGIGFDNPQLPYKTLGFYNSYNAARAAASAWKNESRHNSYFRVRIVRVQMYQPLRQ